MFKNCKKCITYEDNCVECNENGTLLKNLNTINKSYCNYNCKNNNYFYDNNLGFCVKCVINNIKSYNINNENISEFKNYSFFNKIKSEKYILLIKIPSFLKSFSFTNNIKHELSIILNKTIKINYDYYIDINKLTIIMVLKIYNSYWKLFKIKLIIKNLFSDFKQCIFLNKELYFEFLNKNDVAYVNELENEIEKKYPSLNKDTKTYATVKNYTKSTNIATNVFFFVTMILSVFSPGLLSKISVFLPTLIFFKFLTLLDIDYGDYLNTIFSLINLNSNFFNAISFFNLDKSIIDRKLYNLFSRNSKLVQVPIIFMNYINFNYITIIFLSTIILIDKIFIKSIYIIQRLIIFIKSRKISSENNLFFYSDIKNENKSVYHIKNKYEIKILFMKLKLKLMDLNFFLLKYLINIIVSELPNLILITIAYTINFYKEFYTYTAIIINISVFLNYNLLIFYIIMNNNEIKYFKKNNKQNYNILPFFNDYNNYILYFKWAENIKLLVVIVSILLLSYNIFLQLTIIIIVQIIYLLYIIKIWYKGRIIITFIKEIFILIFLIISVIIKILNINKIISLIVFIIWIIIIILSFVELFIFYFKKLIIFLKFFCKCFKKKKRIKVVPIKINDIKLNQIKNN